MFGTDVFDLTRAEAVSHRQMKPVAALLQDYVPGFTDSYVVQSGGQVGVQVAVRETRRILGEHVLTGEDILGARKFPDVIARGISGTHEAHSSYPVTPTAMATGQASGVCAALAAASHRTPRQVPIADVQAELIRPGADLGPSVRASLSAAQAIQEGTSDGRVRAGDT